MTADAGPCFICIWCCRRKAGALCVRESRSLDTLGIVNGVYSGIFLIVNAPQMETGLNEIFIDCSAGTAKDWLRLLLLVCHGKFNL